MARRGCVRAVREAFQVESGYRNLEEKQAHGRQRAKG
jgi:hypothetical protein